MKITNFIVSLLICQRNTEKKAAYYGNISVNHAEKVIIGITGFLNGIKVNYRK